MEWVPTKTETRNLDNNNLTKFLLDASFQGVRRLFILAFDNTENGNKKVERNSHTKYFPSRVNKTNYNVLIDGRNFYDQLINYQIKKYDQIRKTSAGQGDDYTTGCLSDYQNFKDHYQLIKHLHFFSILVRLLEILIFCLKKSLKQLKTNQKNKRKDFLSILLGTLGASLPDFTSLFSPYDFKKNDGIILSYFKEEWN